MASKFISYVKHGVAESTMLKATKVGHHFNAVADVDIDNGSVCTLGERVRADIFKAVVPTVGNAVHLVLTVPKIYNESEAQMQEESNFYNGAGEAMRLYELGRYDRFTLSKEAFAEDAVPAVGKYVVVDGTGYKLTTSDSKPSMTTYGFVGHIYEVAKNGNYRIFVDKNEEVWA